MSADEIRFLRESMRMLALNVRETVRHLNAVTAAARAASDEELAVTLYRGIENDLLELDASLLRLIDSLPQEDELGQGQLVGIVRELVAVVAQLNEDTRAMAETEFPRSPPIPRVKSHPQVKATLARLADKLDSEP